MKPYYEQDGITIYHGDCRELLRVGEPYEVGSGRPVDGGGVLSHIRADVVLTDPPYGLADRWTGGTWGAAAMYDDARRWDRNIPTATVTGLVAIAPVVIVWGGNLYPLPPSRCWLSWAKSSVMPTLADFELAWTNLDRPSKSWREDRNPDGKRWHPTQKPLSLMVWCLGFAPGDLVLDPFMGSGTTLRAAKELGRRAIGIEIEERYCEIAARRLDQGVLDLGAA